MVVVIITVAIVAIVAGIIAVAVVGARKRREPVAVRLPQQGIAEREAPARSYDEPPHSSSAGAPEAVVAPQPLFDLDLELEAAPQPAALPEIRWSKQFDPRSGVLDDTARLRLIGDLGVVGKEWVVPLLCQAYEEEQRPANRQAALIALATCRSRTAVPTYELALASNDPNERAIATDALADLAPPASKKQRTTIERR